MKCKFEDQAALQVLKLLLDRWTLTKDFVWDEMTWYAFETMRRHVWLHQVLEGTGLHPDKSQTAVMSTMPKDKCHLKVWLKTLWKCGVAENLGSEWHVAIEPFVLELRKDEF